MFHVTMDSGVSFVSCAEVPTLSCYCYYMIFVTYEIAIVSFLIHFLGPKAKYRSSYLIWDRKFSLETIHLYCCPRRWSNKEVSRLTTPPRVLGGVAYVGVLNQIDSSSLVGRPSRKPFSSIWAETPFYYNRLSLAVLPSMDNRRIFDSQPAAPALALFIDGVTGSTLRVVLCAGNPLAVTSLSHYAT